MWETFTRRILGLIPGDKSRICWIPTGVLTLLPIHAVAGADGDVMSRIVSTYAPSLRMLNRSVGHTPAPPRFLGVGLSRPSTDVETKYPGLLPLRNAPKEVNEIAQLYPGAVVLTAEDARADLVERELATCTIFHFAGHNIVDFDGDPLTSSLILHDRPLPVRAVLGQAPIDRYLALISGCHTGNVGTRLSDEAMSTVGAMLFAGFRHSIGGLWWLRDRPSRHFAVGLHRRLTETGDGADPALSLHLLVSERGQSGHAAERCPHAWAAYVHYGG